jgi:hypothetical protein
MDDLGWAETIDRETVALTVPAVSIPTRPASSTRRLNGSPRTRVWVQRSLAGAAAYSCR